MTPSPRAARTRRPVTPIELPPGLAHGTIEAYRAGCSCEPCRAANRADSRARRAERRATPFELIPHGEGGYSNYGCHCETCLAAGSKRNADHYDARLRAAGRKRSKRMWTPEQDAVLARTDLTAAQAAGLVGRSATAVNCRRARLKKAQAAA